MRRVVVTGIGAVTPVGNNVPEFWEAIKNGKNGIAPDYTEIFIARYSFFGKSSVRNRIVEYQIFLFREKFIYIRVGNNVCFLSF